MHRRAFVAVAALSPLWARDSGAQTAPRSARVGLINNATPRDGAALVDAFRQGMSDAGWIEGRNLAIEYRWAESDLSRHPRLVGELLGARVDVIVLAGTAAARAARQATSTVPIVVTAVGDPVELGLVASLARPGANLTGLAWQSSDLATKQIQILHETVPRLSRLAAMWHSANPAIRETAQTAARALDLKLQAIEVPSPGSIPGAFRRRPAGPGRRVDRPALAHVLRPAEAASPSWPLATGSRRPTRSRPTSTTGDSCPTARASRRCTGERQATWIES
jgi:ABC-type uncharacterized transport system substrate-binding protein